METIVCVCVAVVKCMFSLKKNMGKDLPLNLFGY